MPAKKIDTATVSLSEYCGISCSVFVSACMQAARSARSWAYCWMLSDWSALASALARLERAGLGFGVGGLSESGFSGFLGIFRMIGGGGGGSHPLVPLSTGFTILGNFPRYRNHSHLSIRLSSIHSLNLRRSSVSSSCSNFLLKAFRFCSSASILCRSAISCFSCSCRLRSCSCLF